MKLKCPVCGGDIKIENVIVDESEAIVKVTIIGRCTKCGAKYEQHKTFTKERSWVPIITHVG